MKKVAYCNYKEYNRRLTKQVMHELDDEGMIDEVLIEVSALENIDVATSK